MRIGVSMYSYYQAVQDGRLDIPGFIHEAKNAGAEGVELLDFFYKDVEADRIAAKAALAETGLPCPIFSVAQNFRQDQSRRARGPAWKDFGSASTRLSNTERVSSAYSPAMLRRGSPSTKRALG